MNVKTGVKYVEHKNKLFSSTVYSQLLAFQGLEIGIPEKGKEAIVFIPKSLESQRSEIIALTQQLGFNGLNSFFTKHDFEREGMILTIIVDEG